MAYLKNTWNTGDIITKAKLDNIENGIAGNDTAIGKVNGKLVNAVAGSQDGFISKEDKAKLDGIQAQANKYVLPKATTEAIGGIKQAALVPEAAGDTVTQAEFKALLDALKAAGIMANA